MFLVLLASFVGVEVELLLVEHTEETWQIVPLGLVGAVVVVLLGRLAVPRRETIRLLQLLMVLSVVAGFVGLYLHYLGNAAFELEMSPSLAGWALFREAVKGAAPPTLAPAAMAQLGLLGLLYCHRHPLLRGTGPDAVRDDARQQGERKSHG